jgi:hypothetical protein
MLKNVFEFILFQAIVILAVKKEPVLSLRRNVTVVSILPYRTSMFFDLQMVAPALDIAMEELAAAFPEVRIKMLNVKVPGVINCNDLEGAVANVASQLYYQLLLQSSPVSMWLGPGCTNAVGQLATLARGTLQFHSLQNKCLFLLFTKISSKMTKISGHDNPKPAIS